MAPLTRPRRNLLIAIAVAVVAAVIVIAVVLGARPAVAPGPSASASPSASATPTPSPSTSAEAGAPPAAGESPEPLLGEPVAADVPRDATADFGDQVTASLAGSAPFTAQGSQVGEVSGPAVRVTIRIANGSGAPIQLDAVTVNAYYGADSTPAPPIGSDASSTPFSGTLEPGASADASYSFSVPTEDQDTLVVSVGRVPGQPIVVFGR
jgi:hypothetical protein